MSQNTRQTPKTQLNSKNRLLPKFFMGTCLVSACAFTALPAHALSAAVDSGASFPGIGYGAQILDMILKNWENPDKTATGTTSITLRIAKDGRPFSCETRAFSSSKATDASFCETVAKIGTFPPHIGAQNPEITLTFRHDGLSQSVNQIPLENQTSTLSNQATNQLPLQNQSILQQSQNTQIAQAQPDPYHQANQNINALSPNSSQALPSLAPETAPSPTQAELQQNHHLAQQPILSSDQVSILSSNPPIDPQTGALLHTQSTDKVVTESTDNLQSLAYMDTNMTEAERNTNHELQRELTREEALAPPSENLVLPEKAMEEYSKNIFMQARTKIRPPNNIEKGTYSTVARIDIAGSGALQNVVVQKSSGNVELDEAVLSVLKNNVTYPPTPNRDHQSIWLTFTIKK